MRIGNIDTCRHCDGVLFFAFYFKHVIFKTQFDKVPQAKVQVYS